MRTLHGIDISTWQGNVDFTKVKNSGVEFIILREGYGQSTDDKFLEYVQGCKNVGINIVGVYHFLYSTSEDEARAEARSCIFSLAKAGLINNEIIIFSDFEYDTVKKGTLKNIKLGKTECVAQTAAFLDEVAKVGFKTGIYTNIDYYRNMYTKELLSKHIVWLTDYAGDSDYECVFRQIGSKGAVSGISGYVNADVWYRKEQ